MTGLEELLSLFVSRLKRGTGERENLLRAAEKALFFGKSQVLGRFVRGLRFAGEGGLAAAPDGQCVGQVKTSSVTTTTTQGWVKGEH